MYPFGIKQHVSLSNSCMNKCCDPLQGIEPDIHATGIFLTKIRLEHYHNEAESVLVELMQAGDEKALAEVIRRYEVLVARVVIGMLGNTAEAEDVGQETFIRFWNSIGSYRHEAKVSTFLTRIAINLSINELRRRTKRYEWLERSDDKPLKQSAVNTRPDVEQLETQEQLTYALAGIEPDQRSVLLLRMVQGYSTKETADILGIPLGTVLSRLSRGLDKLRQSIKKLEEV
jgi:RNA polymerase sigma-70 factor (ECF subfamily)